MMKKSNAGHAQKGFTIIELMIAISVFSIVLLICMSAIIYIARQYYKGVTITKTQDVSRNISASLGDAVKLNGGEVKDPIANVGGWEAKCIGSRKYSYKLNTILTKNPATAMQSDQVFIESIDPGCSDSSPSSGSPSNPPRELLGENMRLVALSIAPISPTVVDLLNIKFTIAYGGNGTPADDAEVFNFAGLPLIIDSCKTGAASHFCSVVKETKSVYGAK